MRKQSLLLLLCAMLLLPGCGQKVASAQPEMKNGKKVVKFLVRDESPQTSGVMTKAIDALEQSGKLDVSLSYELLPKIDEETELLQFKAGNYSDFRWNTNSDIGWMSTMGMIQPVDWIKDVDGFQTIPDEVLKNITYQGHIYAVPSRAVVTAMYTNKDALIALGWSEADIAALPAKIESGQWTMDDLAALAAEAVAKGVVKYGLITDGGVEWHSLTALAATFGAQYYDKEQDKLILSKSAWMNYFTWWQKAMQSNIVQKSQINMSKDTVNKIVSNGEALFFVCHEGYSNLFAFQNMDRSKFQQWFFSHFQMSKIPSGQKGSPGTSMMKLYVMLVSSKTDSEKIPYIKELLRYIYSQESGLQTNAYLTQFSMPITEQGWQIPAIQSDPFINQISIYVKRSTTWATDPYFPYYLIAHRQVIQKMIVDGITAQQAYDMLKEQLTYNVDAKKLIVEN